MMTKVFQLALIAGALLCGSAHGLAGDDADLIGRELGWNAGYACPTDSRNKRRKPKNFSHCRCLDGFERDEDLEKCFKTVYLTVNNLSYMQRFSSFLVVSHNKYATPLFVAGEPASMGLQVLAEGGVTSVLREMYANESDVLDVFVGSGVSPAGNTTLGVRVNSDYPLVTLGAMCVNTNDCFVALNGAALNEGVKTFYEPAWDAGTEMNNELCTHVPGPACPEGSGNARTETGEGFVHVHRGFHGVNLGRTDLSSDELGADDEPLGPAYDWRNPIMAVHVSDSMME